ncbi:MAG: hypothetical protein JRJ42_10290 [Deltaproteobacteria bacterium]|nr:hypothetical protein [Deltaproteobacteria bacterium]MBW2021009.1 hypothetical protein [Deltaproteobacteria bacterium]
MVSHFIKVKAYCIANLSITWIILELFEETGYFFLVVPRRERHSDIRKGKNEDMYNEKDR